MPNLRIWLSFFFLFFSLMRQIALLILFYFHSFLMLGEGLVKGLPVASIDLVGKCGRGIFFQM